MPLRKLNQSVDLQERLLARFVKPACLIEGELTSPRWVIKLGSGSPQIFDFDQQLTPWPSLASLLDPMYASDLVTIKIVLLNAVKSKPVGWVKSAESLYKAVFKPHIVFLRWRIEQGITTNSDLSSAWFSKFDKTMKARARDGLLDLVRRAKLVLRQVDRGVVAVERDAKGDVKSNAFARLMGLTVATELSGAARAEIEQYFQDRGEHFTLASRTRKKDIEIKHRVMRENTKQYYKPWLVLWSLRSELSHDVIGYCAFRNGRELSAWVKNWTAEPPKTPDAPAYQTSYLINACLKLLLDPVCDQAVDLLKEGIDSRGNIRNVDRLATINGRLSQLGYPQIGSHYEKNAWITSTSMSVREFLYIIVVGAARIIKAAFTARRDGEIARSKVDCVEQDEAGGLWMHCHILKNYNRTERIPIPKSVERAIKLIQSIRDLGQPESNLLYDFQCPVRKRSIAYKFSQKLDMIAEYFGVPALECGTLWHFTPHQFRKFFGVTYFWRWAFPNLTALTFHFRHFNADTTRSYIKMKAAEALRMRDEKAANAWQKINIERMADFESCGRKFVAWAFEAAAKGDMIGALARRITAEIKSLKEKFLPELQVTAAASDDSFDAAVEDLVKMFSIQLHPEGHSVCGCGVTKEDALLSQCNRSRAKTLGVDSFLGPAFEFATEHNCLVCPHRGQLRVMSPHWENEYRTVQTAISHATPDQAPILQERAALIATHALQGAC